MIAVPAEEPVEGSVRTGLTAILRRRRWVWGWLLAGIPILFGAGRLLGPNSVAVTVAWAIVFVALTVRHQFVRCPRCHEFFNWSRRGSHRFTDECLHCGLGLGSVMK